jgi:hypothetical protein
MLEKDRIYIPYAEARLLIKEADLLLYRGNAWYSWFIKKATHGEYSHIGLASWHNGKKERAILETVEFHGYRGGGVTTKMSNLFPKFSKQIDIYRCSHICQKLLFDPKINKVVTTCTHLQNKDITNTMRSLTGLPYGWKRIWWTIKRNLALFRFFYNLEDLTYDSCQPIIYPVCSTAIAYSFNKNNFDLISQRSDSWTAPSDISTSPLVHYLFTIV